MTTDRIEAVLAATEAAHGAYETSELHGVYDEAWASWYATYAVDHGIGEALGRRVTADELAAFLTAAWADRSAAVGDASEPWPSWMARRLVESS